MSTNHSITKDFRLLPSTKDIQRVVEEDALESCKNIQDKLYEACDRYGTSEIECGIAPLHLKPVTQYLNKWAKLQNYDLVLTDNKHDRYTISVHNKSIKRSYSNMKNMKNTVVSVSLVCFLAAVFTFFVSWMAYSIGVSNTEQRLAKTHTDLFNGPKHYSKSTFWYKDGVLSRDDGPAIEWKNGDEWWYKDGMLHREDGPAIDRLGILRHDEYWYRGESISKDKLEMTVAKLKEKEKGPVVQLKDSEK